MLSTTRLSPGLITAGWTGEAPCAHNSEGAIKIAASKTPRRNLAKRAGTHPINSLRVGSANSLFPLLTAVKESDIENCSAPPWQVFAFAVHPNSERSSAILPSQ